MAMAQAALSAEPYRIDARTNAHAFSLGNRAVTPARRIGRIEQLESQVAGLLQRAHIAIVYGGDKSDPGAVIHQSVNSRSWKSYRSVAEDIADSLRRQGAQTVSVMPEDMRLGERLRDKAIDMAWLNTGGVQGRTPMSHAAAMLEMMGVPYLGHDPLLSAVLDSKYIFKQNIAYLGLPTAAFAVWNPGAHANDDSRLQRRFEQAFGDYAGPFIVKPVSGRASLHVHVVDDPSDLQEAIEAVYSATENDVLIETYLPGREFCIAVGGPVVSRMTQLQRGETPFVFSAVERLLDSGERIFTSMDSRPITNDRIVPLTAARDAAIIKDLTNIARRVYEDMQLEALVRLDIRADANGVLHILEANPKPDLAAPRADKTSIVCTGLAQEAMTYDDLIRSILADRVDLLFCKRRGAVGALDRLLD